MDWLPTFYELGGGDPKDLGPNIDGISMKETLEENLKMSPRTQMIYNIKSEFHAAARFSFILIQYV